MSQSETTKTCCGGHYPLGDLFCDECREALEETHYRLWIVVTFGAAAAIEWLFAHGGVLREFRATEAIMLGTLLLQLAYPLAKLVQKLRDPERHVLREMGSVFADRWSRVLFISAWIYVGLLWSGRLPKSPVGAGNLVDPSDAPLRAALVTTSLAGFAIVSALLLADQGLRFFDLRVANTYRQRH